MQDQEYLSVLLFDGMERFHDLQAVFFVLRYTKVDNVVCYVTLG